MGAYAAVLHSNGDGMDLAVKDGRIVGVRGRADDRVNHGRLDPKNLFGWQANNSADRLTTPLVREGDQLVESTWDEAMSRVVARSKQLLDEQGPSTLGFYTSGQLFAEKYYTLAAIAHGAIGTNHVDGNTRLCTATAAESLKQSFGCDGQPASYSDVDHADVIALFGHNVAETQAVWSRILDRLAGPNPPSLLCVDPRDTVVARASAVHLAPLPGTNGRPCDYSFRGRAGQGPAQGLRPAQGRTRGPLRRARPGEVVGRSRPRTGHRRPALWRRTGPRSTPEFRRTGIDPYGSQRTGRQPPRTGLLLLADLRRLHRKAAGVALDWELLAQGAQAAKDTDLVELTQRCHPQTLRQLKWTNALLKTLSPQIIAS
ncbi:Molybdopterin oxidoreductase [Kibdelosporangium aridum]|uniref:Molybdopterin oxidoreductase n=1 Tax=Kibdelosporangium aridum TaxID=2030 RepID=A0A1W1ZHJ3_KIBAR|nr:Molybdopterin oxidoreductase [Kibdelosporangium aridum]